MEHGTIHSSAGNAAAVLPGMTGPERKPAWVPVPGKTTAAAWKRFGRYEALRLIGEGAMGKVFLARDPVLNRQVAIKVIAVDTLPDSAKRLEYVARFSLEAKLSAQLNHQSIVPVYDAGAEDGIPWIAFQFIDGVTLDKILQRHGKLSLKWAVHIALDLASALQQAHHIHVIHRDIKPANIIVERSGGIAKLTDFGVAKTPWASLTCDGNAMGSPGYMSPEQIEGFAIDERSDLFSFGVVLYEMITGMHPFARDSIAATAYAIIGGTFTPAGVAVQGVPPRLDAFISHCLATDPHKRIPSAAHCIDQLREIMSGTIPRPHVPLAIAGRMNGIWRRLKRNIEAVLYRTRGLLRTKNPVTASRNIGRTWTSSDKTVLPPGGAGKSLRVSRLFGAGAAIPVISRLFQRHGKDAAMIAIGTAALSCLFIIHIMLSAARGTAETLFLPAAGLDKKEKALVSGFRAWLLGDNLDSAYSCAKKLAETARGSALGEFMLGIVASGGGNFGAALLNFEAARAQPEGARLFERNRRYFVNANASRLEQGRAPDGLVMVLAKQFGAADDPGIHKAVYDTPYWPRWNALRIMQAAGKHIDLARVFMLDLAFADNVHTRIQAARDLGEMGDRRAIPALRRVCAKGANDAFVAAAASKALEDILKK